MQSDFLYQKAISGRAPINGQLIPSSTVSTFSGLPFLTSPPVSSSFWRFIAFNPSDGTLSKWYEQGTDANFLYEDQRAIGGMPKTWVNAQLIPTSWGVIAFLPSQGLFAKWYEQPGQPDFKYMPVGAIGGEPGTWVNAQLIPTSWGVIAFNPTDGTYARWYDTQDQKADFIYKDVQAAPGNWVNAQLIPTTFTRVVGNFGRTVAGVIAFNPNDGSFQKWYDDPPDPKNQRPDFIYQDVRYIQQIVASNTWVNSQLIPTSWGVIAFNPSDGSFAKWYGSPDMSADFQYLQIGNVGTVPGASGIPQVPGVGGWENAQLISFFWINIANQSSRSGVVAYKPSDGTFEKWYD